jgi:hypothetical protein
MKIISQNCNSYRVRLTTHHIVLVICAGSYGANTKLKYFFLFSVWHINTKLDYYSFQRTFKTVFNNARYYR